MSAILIWVAKVLLGIVLEVAIATLLAGPRWRRPVAAAALWGNLTFESLHALLAVSGGAWPLAGFVGLLFGETAVYEILTPLRAIHAIAIVLIANLASATLAFALV